MNTPKLKFLATLYRRILKMREYWVQRRKESAKSFQ